MFEISRFWFLLVLNVNLGILGADSKALLFALFFAEFWFEVNLSIYYLWEMSKMMFYGASWASEPGWGCLLRELVGPFLLRMWFPTFCFWICLRLLFSNFDSSGLIWAQFFLLHLLLRTIAWFGSEAMLKKAQVEDGLIKPPGVLFCALLMRYSLRGFLIMNLLFLPLITFGFFNSFSNLRWLNFSIGFSDFFIFCRNADFVIDS